MVGNTGTYLDSPHHRYAEGTDLAGLPLSVLADLDTVIVRVAGSGVWSVDVGALAAAGRQQAVVGWVRSTRRSMERTFRTSVAVTCGYESRSRRVPPAGLEPAGNPQLSEAP